MSDTDDLAREPDGVYDVQPWRSFAVLPGRWNTIREGRAVLFQDKHYEQVVGPNDTIYLPRGSDPARLVALGRPVEVATMTSTQLAEAPGELLPTLQHHELQRQLREQIELSREMQDLIDHDGSLAPGPYTATQARLVIAVVEDPMIQTLVPDELRSRWFNDRFLLVFANYPQCTDPQGRSLSYRELCVFVPVLGVGRGGPGLYCPELYPDNMMAIVVGREIHGWPKLHANTYLRQDRPNRTPNRRLEAPDEDIVCVLNDEIAAALHVPGWTKPAREAWPAALARATLGDDLDARCVSRALGGLVGGAVTVDDWVQDLGQIPALLPRNLTTREDRIEQLVYAPLRISNVTDDLMVARGCPLKMNLGRLKLDAQVDVFNVRLDLKVENSSVAVEQGDPLPRKVWRRARHLGGFVASHAWALPPAVGQTLQWLAGRR